MSALVHGEGGRESVVRELHGVGLEHREARAVRHDDLVRAPRARALGVAERDRCVFFAVRGTRRRRVAAWTFRAGDRVAPPAGVAGSRCGAVRSGGAAAVAARTSPARRRRRPPGGRPFGSGGRAPAARLARPRFVGPRPREGGPPPAPAAVSTNPTVYSRRPAPADATSKALHGDLATLSLFWRAE